MTIFRSITLTKSRVMIIKFLSFLIRHCSTTSLNSHFMHKWLGLILTGFISFFFSICRSYWGNKSCSIKLLWCNYIMIILIKYSFLIWIVRFDYFHILFNTCIHFNIDILYPGIDLFSFLYKLQAKIFMLHFQDKILSLLWVKSLC